MAITSTPTIGDTYSSSLWEDDFPISVSVSFSEAVTVTGAPQLALTIGTQTRQADYQSGSGASSLRFGYQVQSSDVDADGVSIAANALTLNGGTIRSAGGVNANLSLGAHAVSNASGHKVEGRIHLSIASSPAVGDTYGVNEFVAVRVGWQFGAAFRPATPGGSGIARLALTIGSATRQVEMPLTDGLIGNRLLFAYEIQSGDVDADGLSIAANALTVTGGTLQYVADGTPVHLNFGTHAFANDDNRKVNGGTDNAPVVRLIRPIVNPNGLIVTPPTARAWHIGERIELAVAFSEPVSVTGTPRLALTIGTSTRQAEYLNCGASLASFVRTVLAPGSRCPENTLVFGYVVQSSDVDADGISVASTALTLNGGTISDRGGNAANLALNSLPLSIFNNPLAPRKVNGGMDSAPFSVFFMNGLEDLDGRGFFPHVSRPQSGTAFVAGETIEVTLLYNEPVRVTGTPQLALTVGTWTRQAVYLRGAHYVGDPAGTHRLLTFGYTVKSSDGSRFGRIRIATNVALNGGTIRDSGNNNNADLTIFPSSLVAGVNGGISLGGGAPPPPANERPVAVGEFGDVDLDPGESMEVSLLGKFRDPEGGALAFSAESLNPEVAGAVVSNGRLWVDGRSAGQATVFVTAEDSGGLRARLAFKVRVGRVLSFVRGSASAPEGGVARLGLELNSPSERAVVVGWVLEADGDPLTADADADDHGAPTEGAATFAAGGTEAFIEVPILDDGDIEPAREFLRVRLLAPASEADWALGLATATVVVQEGVCDRSAEVRDALRGSRECWAPSVRDLAGQGYLDLRGRGIAALRGKDLLGLSGLRVLHLHRNRLAELPEGLFAGLGSLERLRLDGNRLATLPAGLFEDSSRLSSLDLSGNRLSGLPSGLLSGAPSLSRLDLSGNRVESLPAGFFTGASGLAELNLLDNPGAPFTLTMNLARTDAEPWAPGPATVAARVREGAPFALSANLAVRGSAELSTETARIGAGETSSASIMVALTAGGAARLSPAGAPEVPAGLCGDVQDGRHPCFQGIRTAAGPGLLLFKRPPRLVRAVPGLEAESLGGAASLDLAEFFKADGGEELTWAAESSDASLASARVEGGVLRVLPNGDGLEGFVTVTVTATDADGLSAEAAFEVEVLPESRPFSRGWRLLWLTGASAPAADASGELPPGAEPQ